MRVPVGSVMVMMVSMGMVVGVVVIVMVMMTVVVRMVVVMMVVSMVVMMVVGVRGCAMALGNRLSLLVLSEIPSK